MKRRKGFALLAVCGMVMGMGAVGAQARTIGIDNGDGTVDYYYCYPVGEAEEAVGQEDIAYQIKKWTGSSEDVSTEVSAESGGDIETSEEAGWILEASEGVTSVEMLTDGQRKQENKRAEEYKKVGIGQNEQGAWIWNGRPIYFVLDEDGSICTTNTYDAENEMLYVYVSRNEDGEVINAEVIDGKEVLEKMAMSAAGKMEF